MGAGHLAHEQDDRHDHQRRCHDGGRTADHARESMAHHAAAGCHQHEEERAEKLGEQATPFLVRVVEVGDAVFDALFVASEQSGGFLLRAHRHLTSERGVGILRRWLSTLTARGLCLRSRLPTDQRPVAPPTSGPVRRGPGRVSAFSRNRCPGSAEKGVGGGRNAHLGTGPYAPLACSLALLKAGMLLPGYSSPVWHDHYCPA